MSFGNLFVIFAFIALVTCKVYKPRRGISKQQAFNEYNAFWNKTHASASESNARFLNFLENAKKIAAANKYSQSIGSSATFGFTKFSDMSPREFKTKMTGFKPKKPIVPPSERDSLLEERKRGVLQAPSGAIDWVAAGKTTAIKNQEQCGSCWAFSATETIESAILIASGSVQEGAPQEIVDCDTSDQGCNGGDPAEAMQWLIGQGGQDLESCYPYTGQDGTCNSQSCTPTNKISSTASVGQDEGSVYTALQSMPPSICCDASAWQNYNGGVLQGSQCGDSVDHAIQLTGYSPDQNGYWIVRNSWGADWGENGFIWLQYGSNTCDITAEVTTATA
jgi:C1A family cysteine protease